MVAWDACPDCSLLHSRHKDLHDWGFLGAWDWTFKFRIPWGVGDSMVWESWELGLWGLPGAVGLKGIGEFGIPSLRMGAPNFGVPQRGKSLL